MMSKRYASPEERLMSQVFPVTESGCWIWMGALIGSGYGNLGLNKKSILAHRFSYETFVGPIPIGIFVLHHCDIRCCINPDHLFLGDHKINSADMFAKGRESRRDGEQNGRAKLTMEQVEYIRSASIGCQRLAKLFGMNKSAMARIRSGERWKSKQPRTR